MKEKHFVSSESPISTSTSGSSPQFEPDDTYPKEV